MQPATALLVVFVGVWLPEPAVSASVRSQLSRTLAARSLSAAGLPDPTCASGAIGLKTPGKPQACCPHYCGECSDYSSCHNVRGQNSTRACCASEVLALECGQGAPANVCLKKCTDAVPPCILPDVKIFTKIDPSVRSAVQDCNQAVADWRKRAGAAKDIKPTWDHNHHTWIIPGADANVLGITTTTTTATTSATTTTATTTTITTTTTTTTITTTTITTTAITTTTTTTTGTTLDQIMRRTMLAPPWNRIYVESPCGNFLRHRGVNLRGASSGGVHSSDLTACSVRGRLNYPGSVRNGGQIKIEGSVIGQRGIVSRRMARCFKECCDNSKCVGITFYPWGSMLKQAFGKARRMQGWDTYQLARK